MKEIIEPTMRGMADSGYPFSGVFFAGLMITAKGPELIEYNVRFGDPECQVLMMRLKSDLLPLLFATANGTLDQVSRRMERRPGTDRRHGVEGLSRLLRQEDADPPYSRKPERAPRCFMPARP